MTVCALDGRFAFPAWSGDDHGAKSNAATMTAATEKAVELRGFIGRLRVLEGRWKSMNNIDRIFD